MPKPSLYALVWSEAQQQYELTKEGRNLRAFRQEDEPEWFAWVEGQAAFAFEGRAGHLSVVKEARSRGDGYWYAYSRQSGRTRKRYLGRNAALSLLHLEETALALLSQRSEPPSAVKSGQSVKAKQQIHKQPVHSNVEAHTPLLASKLSPPRLPHLLVERSRLLARLDTMILPTAPGLALLQAPAGFGKTTLVNQWIASRVTQQDFPLVAWISLEAGDNELFRFWRYVIAACQPLHGGDSQATLAYLSSIVPLPFAFTEMEKVLTHLLNDLVRCVVQGGLLVLDDYHVITDQHIHEALAFFIDHLPKTVHVLLLSRSEPPLSLVRRRARGEIYELHLTDLRFSSEETIAFLYQALPITLSAASLLQLDVVLEGWAAGLRLLALTLQGKGEAAVEQALLSLSEHSDSSSFQHRALLDYFVTEILDTQPAPMQLFLLQTSIPRRLNGSLCDAMTGGEDSEAQLAMVEQAGIFLEALDGSWYRYHLLFAEAMRREASRRLGSETFALLSLRASDWYEQQDMLPDAVEAALLAHDRERVARLIELVAAQEPVYDPETLLRWLASIPEAKLRERPMLCFIYGIAYQASQEASSTSEALALPENVGERVELLLQMAEEGWRSQENWSWLGAIPALRALSVLEHGAFSQAVAYAREALALLPEEDLDVRIQLWHSTCLLLVGMERLLAGFPGDAQRFILDAQARSQALRYGYLTRQISLSLGRSYLLRGEFRHAQEVYRQVLIDAREQGDHELIADSLLGLASLAFEWNELATVEQQVQEAAEHIHFALHQKQELQERITFQLALIEYAQGQASEALGQLTAQLARFQQSSTVGVLEILPFALGWWGRLLLATGDLEAVQHYLEVQLLDQEKLPFIHTLETSILKVRLSLAQEKAQEALPLLERLLSDAMVQEHRYYALEIQLLMVLAYAACKQSQPAQRLLRKILIVAKAEGFLRLFVNEGEPLVRLLRSLLSSIEDNSLRSYLQTVLRAFALSPGSPASSADDGLLFEPLSSQERRVLRLLAAGCSNQEIADELIVSVNTVKDHVKHLYRKLGVNNRLQASSIARLMKLD
ncbi:LuxR family transcriptional regulator [Reticulibacter mediterranei]|uniref:LuxR family transcriptional regulator n=1 Tax=Reticulibacter mediterranei TaxID=2778369 RepID=A0A8J3IHF4_9CHLR|nr:LuxR C-terminal-related transcriptional regulator [Reticulibacter mediterranei]GHO95624.1 LuxR family transcriptional regulator [Reticulibacter mediterranei]